MSLGFFLSPSAAGEAASAPPLRILRRCCRPKTPPPPKPLLPPPLQAMMKQSMRSPSLKLSTTRPTLASMTPRNMSPASTPRLSPLYPTATATTPPLLPVAFLTRKRWSKMRPPSSSTYMRRLSPSTTFLLWSRCSSTSTPTFARSPSSTRSTCTH